MTIRPDAESMKTSQLQRMADAEHQLHLHTSSRRRKITFAVAAATLVIAAIFLLAQHIR